jgi:hypothetical protein
VLADLLDDEDVLLANLVSLLACKDAHHLAHVVDKHCPHCNGRKRHLEINPKLCRGCGKCKPKIQAILDEINGSAK